MRDAVVAPDRYEAFRVAAEIAVLRHTFRNKIAVLIPNHAERIARAALMKACMAINGLEGSFFTAYQDAFEWRSEVTGISWGNT